MNNLSRIDFDSLFIHIMPPVTLHCLLHLTPAEMQLKRFPAIFAIKYSSPDNPIHYSLMSMILWSTVPYVVWLSTYHFFISVRRRDKIAAGRPTSFTWLRKSYASSWIGRIVLSLPESLQEPGFMLTQYLYALGSMLPCPIWFWYRWPSAIFIFSLFTWSIYNGATYYIDVFGKRFQKELEQMKRDVAKWQTSPDAFTSPSMTPRPEDESSTNRDRSSTTPVATPRLDGSKQLGHGKSTGNSIDNIPLLESKSDSVSGIDGISMTSLRERKSS